MRHVISSRSHLGVERREQPRELAERDVDIVADDREPLLRRVRAPHRREAEQPLLQRAEIVVRRRARREQRQPARRATAAGRGAGRGAASCRWQRERAIVLRQKDDRAGLVPRVDDPAQPVLGRGRVPDADQQVLRRRRVDARAQRL